MNSYTDKSSNCCGISLIVMSCLAVISLKRDISDSANFQVYCISFFCAKIETVSIPMDPYGDKPKGFYGLSMGYQSSQQENR